MMIFCGQDNLGKLVDFIKLKHASQVRKYTNEPYYNHVFAVGEASSTYCNFIGYNDFSEICFISGYCHDLIEDTDCSLNELELFLESLDITEGKVQLITWLVDALTDKYTKDKYPEWNRLERKKLEAIKFDFRSPYDYDYKDLKKRVQFFHAKDALKCLAIIKIQDLIDNSSSITEYDKKFAKLYLKEKSDILFNISQGYWLGVDIFDLIINTQNDIINNLLKL